MIFSLLWRDLIIEKEPYAYVLTAVNMGDRTSATIVIAEEDPEKKFHLPKKILFALMKAI